MFGRMVLPLLGGAPAVWTTALVFYQAVLLGAYLYAHATTAWISARRQAPWHVGLVLAAGLTLPVAVPAWWTPPVADDPVPSLLVLLAAGVGPPFFAVAATSPLLQRWLADTRHAMARDPYVLYAASNLGSLLGLLAYPTVVEPALRLADQSRVWAAGYALFGLLVLGSAVAARRGPTADAVPAPESPPREESGWRARRLHWVLLSLVPASLMLGVTAYLSTDLAAVPLLWVIPLALYLLTFTLTFAPRPPLPHRLMAALLPLALLPVVLVLAAGAHEPLLLIVPAHLAAFFAVAMVCHGELWRLRPPPSALTGFYAWMSLGGVLGGLFAALVAPRLFATAAEYPLMLVLACLTIARPDPPDRRLRLRLRDIGLPVGLAALLVALVGARPVDRATAGPLLGLGALACLAFARRPARFGLGIGAVLLAGTLPLGTEGRPLHAARSFFGIHRVTLDPTGTSHLLLHGTTLHGSQSLDPARRLEPLAYFHRDGPIGQVFATRSTLSVAGPIAVVGLGTGSLACHGRPGERWTFYEIDPVVERIARDPRYFTFLRDCPPEIGVVLGDARLTLPRAPRAHYRLIVLDAYSSDAPPVHLLTREALGVYLDRLTPGGLLAFNISNRHLDLEPVLGSLAREAGLVARIQRDVVGAEARALGRTPSTWLIMVRGTADLGPLGGDPRWRPARAAPGVRAWTDDFAALLDVVSWRGAAGAGR